MDINFSSPEFILLAVVIVFLAFCLLYNCIASFCRALENQGKPKQTKENRYFKPEYLKKLRKTKKTNKPIAQVPKL